MSVEGLNKSAIAWVKRMAWNTIDRWLQKAAYSCRRFNDQKIDGLSISELQADEIHTIIHDKDSRFGSLLRLKSGLVFGLQPLLEYVDCLIKSTRELFTWRGSLHLFKLYLVLYSKKQDSG